MIRQSRLVVSVLLTIGQLDPSPPHSASVQCGNRIGQLVAMYVSIALVCVCVCAMNWSACGHVCKYSASVCVCVLELVSLWPCM